MRAVHDRSHRRPYRGQLIRVVYIVLACLCVPVGSHVQLRLWSVAESGVESAYAQVDEPLRSERGLYRQEGHDPDEILATISSLEGREITVTSAEFQSAWETQRGLTPTLKDTPTQRRATLERLIELKVLSRRAQSLELDQAPRVLDAQDQAAVRRLIIDGFEHDVQSDRLPRHYIEDAKRKNLGLFRHPELRRAVHLLLKPITESREQMSLQQANLLKPIVERIHLDLQRRAVTSAEELKSRVDDYQAWVPQGYEVIFENLGRFALEGRFHRGFSRACFDIKTPKTLTSPIETPFGFHWVWIQEVIAPLDTSDEEIEAEVKKRLLPAVRKHEWKIFMYELGKDVDVRIAAPE